MVIHNSLRSEIFFNPIFITGFSGSRIFRVQVFQGPGFSMSRSRVQVLEVALNIMSTKIACYDKLTTGVST